MRPYIPAHSTRCRVTLALALASITSLAFAAGGAISDKDIASSANTADWLAYGRTHDEQRFSPLKDIHVGNVAQLGVAWQMDLPNDVGLVSTPLVFDGVLYFTGSMNVVRAVDARTGKLSAAATRRA